MTPIRARDLMTTDFETVAQDTPLLDAVKKLQARKLETGKVDVRCLVVTDEKGDPAHLMTEADVIKAILPWWFREKKFSSKVSEWLSKDVPPAALDELHADLARAARKKKVRDVGFPEGAIVSVEEGDSLLKIAHTMHVERIKTLPVVRDGKIVGIVFRAAVFEAIAAELDRGQTTVKSDPAIKVPT